jgi:hypothetical protein
MEATVQFTEDVELLAHQAPQAAYAAVGDHNLDWVDFGDYHRGVVLIHPGEAQATSTLDVDVYEAKDTDGTDAQIIDDYSITQLDNGDAGGGPVAIEINAPEMSSGYHCLQVRVTVGADTYYYSVMFFGTVLRYPPADTSVYTEVVE